MPVCAGSCQRSTEHQRGADADCVPFGADAAERAGADDLVMLDVKVFEIAGVAVAHDHVALAGEAADIGKADGLPVDPDIADRPGADDLVMLDVEIVEVA